MRLQKSLTSGWEFIREPGGPDRVDHGAPTVPVGGWREIAVPGFWQAQFPELARATGAGWYRLGIELDQSWTGLERLVIEFGAVSYYCQGWINGKFVGEHEGGDLGFEWDVSDAARAGANELLVRVVSPSGDRRRFPDFPFEETLHGKRNWYGPNGGIWQPVSLVGYREAWIERVAVRARPLESVVDVQLKVGTAPAAQVADDEMSAVISVIDPDGRTVATSTVADTGSIEHTAARIAIAEPRWWSVAEPQLYTVDVELKVGDTSVDRTSTTCGFRTFEAVDGRFRLNGEPITLAGVLDQDYHDTPGVPTSKAEIVERFKAIQAMGFNTVRCHIKVPSPMYLDAADEVGLMVWCEPPTTSRLTDRARARIETTLFGMIERDRHHPSIVIWAIANEAWGYDLVGSAADRAWLNSLFQRVKADVDDRLIVDNSPCAPNFHIQTDIEDYHFYAVIPELRRRWDDFLDEFVGGAAPTFSPHGDAERVGTEPLVVSEFGAWGLANYECEADEPWWFESGQEWADGAAYVHGAPERAALWHLDAVFGSWAGLCAQTQVRQFNTIRYQIDTMRARPEIAGYVLTELGDVHWESNGLFDMWGRPRNFTDELAPLNREATVIGSVDRSCVWDGEELEFGVSVINDARERNEARVEIHAGGETLNTDLGLLERFCRRSLNQTVVAGCSGTPEIASVEATLSDSNGSIIRTTNELLVIPRIGPQIDRHRNLAVTDAALADSLRALGYDVDVDVTGDEALRVVRRVTEADRQFVESGGSALLLAEDVGALGAGFGEFPPVTLQDWDDALFLGGSWVSAFSWLRRSGRFADLPGGPLMDSAFEEVIPRMVISGIPPARFEYDVMAGVFVGWVHQVAAIVARNPVGLGSMLISTLRLRDSSIVEDPLPNWMTHQLIATALE